MGINEKKRILLVANTARFFVLFEQNDIRILQNMGYQVHCASNFEYERDVDAKTVLGELGTFVHQIDIARSPVSTQNISAYAQLCSLMTEIHFEAVHCHTPMGSVLARLAANKTHTAPVIYTVHGLHFYKGCPIQNRILYEPVERWLAKYTDVLITINEEDYHTAQTFHLRGKAYKISGVGIDVQKISHRKIDCSEKRREIGIPEQAVTIVSVGDLNRNKNHAVAIKAFAQVNIPNSYYVICGEGKLKLSLQEQAKRLGVFDRVRLLGFRKDVGEIVKSSDVFVFPSKREGLSVALMEAMAAGLPCAASRIRGNTDLLGDSYKYYFEQRQGKKLPELLAAIYADRYACGRYCHERSKLFDRCIIERQMEAIYCEVLK